VAQLSQHRSSWNTIRRRIAFGSLFVAVFVVPMSVAGSSVALPAIAGELGAATGPLQWVVNSFNVAFAGSTLLWGWFADRFGHRRTFFIGAVIVAAGSAASALAPTVVSLDIARAVVGVGATALLTATTSLLSTLLDGAARSRAFAVLGTVFGFGLAFGPTSAGVLIDAAGWRGVFAVFGAAAAVGAVGAIGLPRAPGPSPTVQRSGFGALVRDRQFLAVCMVPVVQAFAFIAILTYMPVALGAVWGLTSGQTGVWMLFMTGPLLLGSPVGAALVRRGWSLRRVFTVALGALIAGDLVLLALGTAPIGVAAVGMILTGVGFGLPIGLLDGEAQAAAPAGLNGAAAGLFNLIRLGAEALGGAVVGVLLSAGVGAQFADGHRAADVLAGGVGHATQFAAGWRLMMVVVLGLVCLGTLGALLLMRTRNPGGGQARPTVPAQAEPSANTR
jgi:predicted MFS family arabinose efflux permease